ncbi:predicted protein [Sclerotinia sclerotiorum 1980 UF-70]|uniref:Uncharacterized protein n=2 Tax=Sclerotinia sclerotiorum (strain ATCC 18683 / 1980 / Ss-1) TaxID=665079 RepID=A7EDK4_SCLS1|nr:predicted protein [Sclerotinia sclerotiorum 1980 UF-70]APA10921.1 hypothetical protein sscle_07g056910 [Sclerotinia sclerotiorum 1980 UF-70]EDO00920.1 predicted protein [Sclerotinia sclerotiorum 1980 UF-70]
MTSLTSSATAPATPSSITSTTSSTSVRLAPNAQSDSNTASIYTKSPPNNVSLGPVITRALRDLALILLKIITLIIPQGRHSPNQKEKLMSINQLTGYKS